MNAASSSSSSTLRAVVRPLVRRTRSARLPQSRRYAAAAAVLQEPTPAPSDGLAGPSTSPALEPVPSRPRSSSPSSPTTPSSASTYLSDLLHLPPSRAFPPPLALQILTHKSYRFAHPIRRDSAFGFRRPKGDGATRLDSLGPQSSPEEVEAACAPHNARMSFLGRRAATAYLAMFIHDLLSRSSTGPSLEVAGESWLRGKTLEQRLDDLRHVNNLGREVGERWGVGEVMRWDRNETSREGGHVKIKGLTVEAILGGVFTQLGSPAAQRTFHLHILPYLVGQFRDARIQEAAEEARKGVLSEFGGGIVARQ